MSDEVKQQQEQDIDETKALRVEVDKALQAVQVASARKPGRAISLAVTKLEEAKMWLGKRFEEIGRELPEEYRDKYNPNGASDPEASKPDEGNDDPTPAE